MLIYLIYQNFRKIAMDYFLLIQKRAKQKECFNILSVPLFYDEGFSTHSHSRII